MTSEFLGDDGFDTAEVGAIGVGQTWQDMSASRAKDVVYTNNTGMPIQLLISRSVRGGATAYTANLFVDSINICAHSSGGATELDYRAVLNPIIPDGSTYEITGSAGFAYWYELR